MSASRPQNVWRLGLGAGVLGAVCVALKYSLRPPTKRRVPDSISPAVFATKVLHTTMGEVVYHESGRGPLIIFVHNVGLGASSFEWSRVYPKFTRSHRVIALDLVGFGESERPEAGFSAANYVRMLAEFTRALEWETAPIFVASGLTGGFCALLAGEHPDLVSQLILHMPNGTGDIGRQRLTFFSKLLYRTPLLARFLYRNHLSLRSAVAHWLEHAAFEHRTLLTDEMIDVFTTCAQQSGAEHAAIAWMSGKLGFDLAAALPGVSRPVAFLCGNAGAVSTQEQLDLQRVARSASCAVIHGAGSLAALELPGAMTDAIYAQLQSETVRSSTG